MQSLTPIQNAIQQADFDLMVYSRCASTALHINLGRNHFYLNQHRYKRLGTAVKQLYESI